MIIWSGEIVEINRLYKTLIVQYPFLAKELEQLVKTNDANVVMLYSRRCLEVIVSELCETELKRPRKTEPLKGIIDKLNSEEKVPSHIISSMLSLNSMSTYGTHPKDFDPEQVKPVLNNLAVILKWYIRYKDFKVEDSLVPVEKKSGFLPVDESDKKINRPKRKIIFVVLGCFLLLILAVFVIPRLIKSNSNRRTTDSGLLKKTIAVLPFRNLSNDSLQLYFCDGFMEEVLNNLQRVHDFTVRSRTSTDQYRNGTKSIKIIGNELNVNYLVEGSVSREDNKLKIWVQLINARTDEHIWANDYTRELKQIFSLQSEIAKEIAGELKTVLSPDEISEIDRRPTDNLEAYNYYLLGNDYYRRSFEKQNFEIAAGMYIKAIECDQNFALAYTRLSICYMALNWFHYDLKEDRLTKSKAAIDKAFEIDPELPEAHLALGTYYYWGQLNYSKALDEFEIVQKRLNNNSECLYLKGSVYLRAGEFSIALENFIKSFEYDPGLSRIPQNIAATFTLLSKYNEAEEYYDKAILLNPA
jgi:TolB-like protein